MKYTVLSRIYRGIIALGLFSLASCGPAKTTSAPLPTANLTNSPATSPTSLSQASQLPPVKVDPSGFLVDGKPFRFVGANSIYFGFYKEYKFSIEEAIRSARENGVNVIRIYLGFGEDTWGGRPMEEYDRVLDIAAQNGMYVIAVLTDCCCMGGDWSRTLDAYYKQVPYCNLASAQGLEALKTYIKNVLLRKNTVNGKIYRDDATILAWDIANEPYLPGFSDSELNAWLSQTTQYIKSLDANHLITFGLDASSSLYDSDGPHYEALNVPGLDFFSFHYNQPDFYTASQRLDLIQFRVKKFLSMGKPVVLEEFGVGSQRNLGSNVDQDTLAKWVGAYESQMDVAFSAGASGAMFWGWGVPETRKVPLWWRNEDHDISETEFCTMIRGYQFPELGSFDLSALPVEPPNDDFEGAVLDPSKWQASVNGGGGVSQDGRVILTVEDTTASSNAAVWSTWSFPGDFDTQIEFEIGEGWGVPATDHLDGAAFGASIAGQNYHVTRLRSGGEDTFFAWSSNETLTGKAATTVTAGKYRLVRTGTNLALLYDAGNGWQTLAEVTAPASNAQVYFMNGSVNASQAFTTYFDNFQINSGLTTYRPLGAPPLTPPTPNPALAPLPGSVVIPVDALGKNMPWLPIDKSARPSVYYFYFNLKKPPFDNALVRQAFAAAIDREALVEVAKQYSVKNPQPATTFTPSETLGRNLYNAVGIPFNPGHAKELLAQAGYADANKFPPVTLLIGVSESGVPGFHEKIAETTVAMWQQHLGVTVTVEKLDLETFFSRIASNPPEIFRTIFFAGNNDPNEFLPNFHTGADHNYGSFSNRDFDQLVDAAANSHDPEYRQELYIQAEQILCETETALLPVYHASYP